VVTPSISALDLRRMLDFVGRKIIAQEAYLNSLDAAVGDGDHGITMRLGFQVITDALGESDPRVGLDVIFRKAGMSFMGATGGAIGVIFGKMLVSGAVPLHGVERFGTAEFKILLREMELTVINTGKAKVGDKTILDAVHASNQAMSSPDAQDIDDLALVVSNAAKAAEKAAQDTAGMICRVGRGSRLGARTLGCPDPGAVSFGIILRAMADWLAGQDPLLDAKKLEVKHENCN
jgi:phosphoenolpyruvate---glycerone phosphotransferase subunit DhaL